jgi:hypothetical protein
MRRRHSGQPRLNKPKCARRIRHSARRIRKNNEKPMINPGKSGLSRSKSLPPIKTVKNGTGPCKSLGADPFLPPFGREGRFCLATLKNPWLFYPLLPPPHFLLWPSAQQSNNLAHSTLSELWANLKLPFVFWMSWLALVDCRAQDSPSIARAAQLFGDGAGQDDELR